MKARDMACLLLVGLSVLSISLCISCSRESSDLPESGIEIPEMELRDADYILGENVAGASSDKPMVMHATLIKIYGKGRDTVLNDVSFKQGDSLSGSCKEARVSSANKRAVLSGDVRVSMVNDDNKVTIESQRIEWDGDENTLMCSSVVSVSYGDGTKIMAEGFSASMDEDRYEFSRILEGTL